MLFTFFFFLGLPYGARSPPKDTNARGVVSSIVQVVPLPSEDRSAITFHPVRNALDSFICRSKMQADKKNTHNNFQNHMYKNVCGYGVCKSYLKITAKQK